MKIQETALSVLISASILLSGCSTTGSSPRWDTLITQANGLQKEGKYDEAIKLYEQAAKEAEKKYGPESAELSTCLLYAAEMYRAQQEWIKAAMALKQTIVIKEKWQGKDDPEVKELKQEFAQVKQKLKDYKMSAPGISDSDFADDTAKKPAGKKKRAKKKSK